MIYKNMTNECAFSLQGFLAFLYKLKVHNKLPTWYSRDYDSFDLTGFR